MRIKLKDIAERANVSTATVSRVLNNNANVDERTRELVLQISKEIGYPWPETRKELETAKCITLAVNTPSGDNSSYLGMMMDGIETVGRQNGYQVKMQRILLEDPADEELEQVIQAEAIIILGGAVQPRIFDLLEQEGIPFVLAAAHRGEREINCVHGNYMLGAAQAVQALANFGHRRIALINGSTLSTSSQDKLAGYRLGLAEAGLVQDEKLILSSEDFLPVEGWRLTRHLLERTRDFSAILYATDSLAIGGISALKEAALEVPGAISVIGFYDEAFAPFTDPPLSSININWQRVGEIAALRIIALLEQRDDERLHITIPVKLVLRASAGPA
jgi:LacI family transcriptional regulator, repressor for deo operon, udp, cdd, tsx, nupC, and nupG